MPHPLNPTAADYHSACVALIALYTPDHPDAAAIVDAALRSANETGRASALVSALLLVIAEANPEVTAPDSLDRLRDLGTRYLLESLDPNTEN